MKRENIKSPKINAWEKYLNVDPKQAADNIYNDAISFSQYHRDWYWAAIKSKRKMSLGVRSIAFVLLLVGAICPIIAGLENDPDIRLRFTQSAVAALAAAGLVQAADKIFGWSSGWLRYITTVTAMENLTNKFQLDWAKTIIEKHHKGDEPETRALFELSLTYQQNIAKLQSDETDKWVAEFNSGLALMGEMIRSQRESADRAVQEAKAQTASPQQGAIDLELKHKDAVQAVTVKIDDAPGEAVNGSHWSIRNIDPGLHTITVSYKDNEISKTIKVLPGDVTKVDMTIA